MKEKSLKKNALYSVLKVFLSLVFPLITFPYASRILLPEGMGKVNFANSIIGYFLMLSNLGINVYAVREASKLRNDKKALTKFFKEMITINFVCCIISYLLLFCSISIIPKFHEYKYLLLLCSIKIIFSVIGIEWIFTAFEDFKYITIRSFFVQLFSLAYFFIFVRTKEDILHYAFFGVLIAVGSNILNFFFLNNYVDLHYKTKLEIKKHFKSIFIFFGMTVVTSIYTMLDSSMLGFLSTSEEVGFYAVSTKLSHMLLGLITAITSVLLPRLTDYVQKNDRESFSTVINKSANIILLLSIPMTFGLITLSHPLTILLSGDNYLPAIPAMITISPILIIISFGSLTGTQLLPALGKEKYSFYSYIFGAITNVLMNFLLIPRFGALGAAIGTVCAELVVSTIQAVIVRSYIFNKSFFITLTESIAASAIMILLILLIKHFIGILYLQVIISFLSGLFIYGLILYLLRNQYFLFYLSKGINRVKVAFNKNDFNSNDNL